MSLSDSGLTGISAAPAASAEAGAAAAAPAAPAAATARELDSGGRREPETIGRRIDAFLAGRAPEVVFFLGHGDGAHAEAIRHRCGATVLVWEPRPAAPASSAPPRVQVFASLGELVEAAAAITDLASRQVAVGAIPELRDEMPEAFARFVDAVKRLLASARIRRVTVSHSAGVWSHHLATNLPRLATQLPFDLLEGVAAGWPGVVVGAGPSLDRGLDALRRLQGRALLCAASTALPPLARAGIVPDLVVVIEANDNAAHFADVPHLDRVLLLADPQGHPAHFAVPPARNLALAVRDTAAGDWLQRAWGCRPLPSGGSVACLALSALHRLGCDPLVLTGMDLALTDGRTHADGSTQGRRRGQYDAETGRFVFTSQDRPAGGSWQGELAPAWGGASPVPTRPAFNAYRLWFEAAADTWAGDRALINATGGGARIHGWEEIEPDALAAALAAKPPGADAVAPRRRLDAAIAAAIAPDAAALWREVARELAALSAAAAAARTAAGLAARALAELEAGQTARLTRTLPLLSAAEVALGDRTRATRLLNALVGDKAAAAARGDARPPSADRLATTAWSLRQSRRISEAVSEGAGELEALFGAFSPSSAPPPPRTSPAAPCSSRAPDPARSPA
ncbi:DUF115 domain-containing protein [bacterium]|nr:DUF115 domain-containing protein [bacterium]